MFKFFRENKKLFIPIVLGIALIIAISLSLWAYLFLPSKPFNQYMSNVPQNTPLSGYDEQKDEEYDIIQYHDSVVCKLRFGENLTFCNTVEGGWGAYLIYTYNIFRLNTEDYYLRILNRISVTSLYKIESYVIQNGTWILDSTIFEWQNPRDNYIFEPLLCHGNYGSVFDDLIINHSLVEENHEWLDLGYSEIGQLKTIDGYGSILIELGHTPAKNAYFGIEETSNQTKTISYIKKFIFRVEIIWQRYENHFLGWKTLISKVYFLGNGRVESKYGLEGFSGINLMPYTF